jgi:hypothetical protein
VNEPRAAAIPANRAIGMSTEQGDAASTCGRGLTCVGVGPKQVRARSTRRQNAVRMGGRLTAGSALFASYFHESRDFDYRDGNLGLTGLKSRLEAAGGGSAPAKEQF